MGGEIILNSRNKQCFWTYVAKEMYTQWNYDFRPSSEQHSLLPPNTNGQIAPVCAPTYLRVERKQSTRDLYRFIVTS
jgi:hypothetical protein